MVIICVLLLGVWFDYCDPSSLLLLCLCGAVRGKADHTIFSYLNFEFDLTVRSNYIVETGNPYLLTGIHKGCACRVSNRFHVTRTVGT